MLAGSVLESAGIALLIPLARAVMGGPTAEQHWALVGEAVQTYGQHPTLIALVVGVLALGAMRALVLWQRDVRLNALSYELVDRWRQRLIQALARANWQSLSQMRHGALEFGLANDISRLSQGSDLPERPHPIAFILAPDGIWGQSASHRLERPCRKHGAPLANQPIATSMYGFLRPTRPARFI